MDFRTFMASNIVILDGGMGTLLQKRGLKPGESPILWNRTHPEEIRAIHRAYYDAGSHLVYANTFGADMMHYTEEELSTLIPAAIRNAREAAAKSTGTQEKYVAMDVAPFGKLLKPLGELDFEDAVKAFKVAIRLGAEAGADAVVIETMTDSYETKAALLAAKECCDLPVLVSNAYDERGKLMTGADPLSLITMLEGLGADAIGVNCSFGPGQLEPVIDEYLAHASVPVLFKPNAGLPRVDEAGNTAFDITVEEYTAVIERALRKGVRLVGGCCGTTPEYIRAVAEAAEGMEPVPVTAKSETYVCSGRKAVRVGVDPLLIGERINPTGKKRMKQALQEDDITYLLEEAIRQEERGAHALDVNCGMPGIDEKTMLPRIVYEVQCVTDLPLQVDTTDVTAMERALRLYHGKALINSVNGKQSSLDAILPLAGKYGGVLIALTLDDNGIPARAEERVAIAKHILDEAAKYGIDKKDILFDTLTMAVSADENAAAETLKAVRLLHEMGCYTSLGVSNVSFGLPCRDGINGVFFGIALANGLTAAIMNPYSDEMMNAYHSWQLLNGRDPGAANYIAFAQKRAQNAPAAQPVTAVPAASGAVSGASGLKGSILRGMKDSAAKETRALLETKTALEIIEDELIPALDIAGKEYEAKRFYLPQLLLSAEAAKAAFDAIKNAGTAGKDEAKAKKTIILATVKGDIHDIGKNIVHMMMENYGFRVVDLGKDVPKEAVLEAVLQHEAELCGLSALMTTTVPAMQETIELLHEKAPACRIIVGGAVLTAEYAARIGADHYAKDAMEAVRYAESLN